ncbi:MAG: substrate-binding domain-containing protein, partial [Chloroflexota bacterium]
ARSLRSASTKTFGMVVPAITNPFFAEITNMIETYAWEAGYQIILCTSNDPQREAEQLQTLFQRRIDGAIVIHAGTEPADFSREWSVPTIFVDRPVTDYPSIATDNMHGGKLAMQHLVEVLGHEQVAIMAGDAHIKNIQHRMAGAQDVLKAHSISAPESYVVHGTQALETGLMANRFWQLDNPPTAIFATNDIIAIGVWHSCIAANVRVPEDVSIIGYDNILWSSLMVPPLTTIAQPTDAICKRAVADLVAATEGQDLQPVTIELKPNLIVRQSTKSRHPN